MKRWIEDVEKDVRNTVIKIWSRLCNQKVEWRIIVVEAKICTKKSQ